MMMKTLRVCVRFILICQVRRGSGKNEKGKSGEGEEWKKVQQAAEESE